jgi:hypothetical protein
MAMITPKVHASECPPRLGVALSLICFAPKMGSANKSAGGCEIHHEKPNKGNVE